MGSHLDPGLFHCCRRARGARQVLGSRWTGRHGRDTPCTREHPAEPVVDSYPGHVGAQSRVRVQGDLYHPVVPSGAVYVGRQGFGLRRSPWANPFSLRSHDRAEALRLYRQWLVGQPALVERARQELAGKQLACWCHVEDACHADVLAEIIG
ncbi:hypothetical protein C6W10_12545 [Plantactinospora sp. BB1]|nr:hypothetical protein C6W10_12545 [Plantactinospora sp. BB1]